MMVLVGAVFDAAQMGALELAHPPILENFQAVQPEPTPGSEPTSVGMRASGRAVAGRTIVRAMGLRQLGREPSPIPLLVEETTLPRADWQRKWRERARAKGFHQMTVHLDEREVALLDAVAFAVTVAHPDLGGGDVPRSRVPSRTAALRIVLKAALGGISALSHDEAALAMHWVRLASWATWRRPA